MQLTNVVQLSGYDNYDSWFNTIIVVWDTHKLHELVVEGMAAEENNPTKAYAYKELCTLAKNIYILVVCPDILASLLELQNPHLMWKYLKTEYKRNSTFNLVYQFRNLALLAIAYVPSQPISAFIKTFETEYSRLTKLARDSSDDNRKLLAQFLQSDTIKRTFILAFLAQGQKNVVDNLATKDNLSYAAVKQRLLDLDQETPVEMAMAICFKRGKPFTSNLTKPSKFAKLQECTYCLKHFPSNSSGHTWKNCPKVQERGRKKKHASSSGIQEQSNIATSQSENVSKQPFYFDTGATSHMCPDPD